MSYGDKNWQPRSLDPGGRLLPYQRVIVERMNLAHEDKMRLVVKALDEFVRSVKGEVWKLNAPCELATRGRYASQETWTPKAFIGDESFTLVSGFVDKGKVWLTVSPAVPDAKIAMARFELGRAKELIVGFAHRFELFLQAKDDALAALNNDPATYGINPEFGTW
jgi:hypothetical protein